MSLFPLPQGVIDKITQIQRKFLWNGNEDKRAFALIRWELIQLPKLMGGLNVGNMLARNLGLLFKWLWRYFQEPKALWRQIIEAKYKYPQEFRMADLAPIRQGGPWKSLCNNILHHENSKKLLVPGSRMQVGNGRKMLFWHDVWINNSALKS